jgi:glycosyltransferase involved in cell wall biosynthesis
VPIVYNAGGHKEIVSDGENGYLWNKVDELVERTRDLISSREGVSKKAIESSKLYSYEKFSIEIKKIL